MIVLKESKKCASNLVIVFVTYVNSRKKSVLISLAKLGWQADNAMDVYL